MPADDADKKLGLLMHLLPLSGFVLFTLHVPFLNILAPLVLWFMKKDQSPYLNAVGKEVLNFQISVVLAGIVCIPFVFLLIGIPMLVALFLAMLYFIIMAAIAANGGKFYRFPYCLRLIK